MDSFLNTNDCLCAALDLRPVSDCSPISTRSRTVYNNFVIFLDFVTLAARTPAHVKFMLVDARHTAKPLLA